MAQQNGRLPRNELQTALRRLAQRQNRQNCLIAPDFEISKDAQEKKKIARELAESLFNGKKTMKHWKRWQK